MITKELTIAGVLALLFLPFQVISIPIVLLVICMLIDFGTGMLKAWKKKTIASRKSWHGVGKKLGNFLLVLVGVIIDFTLVFMCEYLNIGELPANMVALTTTFWLIVTELISVVENIHECGIELPPFLKPLLKHMKIATESKAQLKDSYGSHIYKKGDLSRESDDTTYQGNTVEEIHEEP